MDAFRDDAPHVELRSLEVRFDSRTVFRDLSCRFERQQISVVLGGSGSGKSTLLRVVGGLQRPAAGSVEVGGESLVGIGARGLARVRQNMGMLFQNGALLDSMTVFDNVALPLREHARRSEADVSRAVHSHLEAVGLEGVDDLIPGELSGGMLRRAALARALVMDPEIVLCDEPFSGLDPPNVARIEALLCRLNRERGISFIVTSHHIPSSLRMAHRLVLIQDGDPIVGTPAEFLAHTDSRVTEFLAADSQPLPEETLLPGSSQ